MLYYTPSKRSELLSWLLHKYPQDMRYFRRMRTDQLYRVYHEIRRKMLKTHEIGLYKGYLAPYGY